MHTVLLALEKQCPTVLRSIAYEGARSEVMMAGVSIRLASLRRFEAIRQGPDRLSRRQLYGRILSSRFILIHVLSSLLGIEYAGTWRVRS